jgi:hypothetical protein
MTASGRNFLAEFHKRVNRNAVTALAAGFRLGMHFADSDAHAGL